VLQREGSISMLPSCACACANTVVILNRDLSCVLFLTVGVLVFLKVKVRWHYRLVIVLCKIVHMFDLYLLVLEYVDSRVVKRTE